MCGLMGRISDTPFEVPTDLAARVLGHRGPDGADSLSFQLTDKFIHLGHVRLSILDLTEAAAQPMRSHDGRWVIVYNGEIYNHGTLRNELANSFESTGDTRTLIEAIAAWGVEATLPRLNGIFAFAVLDTQQNKLYLVRDPCGVKPLYYAFDKSGISFGSEVGAIMSLGHDAFEHDPVALGQYLHYRFVPSPRTMWKGIQKLEPGHVLTLDLETGQTNKSVYISSENDRFSGREEDAVERYADVLRRAVHRQLLSDVPLGVLLSGGVDSALIAALAVEAGAKPTSYTVGFGGQHRECELAAAKETANWLGLPHRSITIDQEQCWSALIPALQATEEPLGTTSIVPMWYLSMLAHQDVKAVLTGQGSDELWGGYQRYQGELISQFLPRSSLWKYPARLAPAMGPKGEILERAFRSLSSSSEVARQSEVYAMFSRKSREELGVRLNEEDLLAPLAYWLDWYGGTGKGQSVERMMAIDVRMNLADDLLLYGDRISMAHSIEARVPLLDNEVVAFAQSLPRSMRLKLGQTKRLHKFLANRLLPEAIVDRPKLGFQSPIGHWLKTDWRDRLEAMLFDQPQLDTLLDLKTVRKLWNEHCENRRDYTRQVFAIIALHVWAEKWLNQKGREEAQRPHFGSVEEAFNA